MLHGFLAVITMVCIFALSRFWVKKLFYTKEEVVKAIHEEQKR